MKAGANIGNRGAGRGWERFFAASQRSELPAKFVLAMKRGPGLNKILGTMHSYPTVAEANKYAAGQWKKANQLGRLLKWVELYRRWRRK
jgi:hypothetical protein